MLPTRKTYRATLACILTALVSTRATNEGQIESSKLETTSSDLDWEARLVACRQDPTWSKVDYEECQRLTGWRPRSELWRKNSQDLATSLDGKENRIKECLEASFEAAKEKYAWAR